jgi:NTP pyrophosphatase (non-canonical NTP hydrolase)
MNKDLEKLTNMFVEFRNDRDWKQFHTLKNLAMSLSIESGELLELFQWKNDTEIANFINSDKKYLLEDEAADVAAYLLLLCHDAGIDLETAIIKKIEKNDKKYPVNKSKGNAKKYTEL